MFTETKDETNQLFRFQQNISPGTPVWVLCPKSSGTLGSSNEIIASKHPLVPRQPETVPFNTLPCFNGNDEDYCYFRLVSFFLVPLIVSYIKIFLFMIMIKNIVTSSYFFLVLPKFSYLKILLLKGSKPSLSQLASAYSSIKYVKALCVMGHRTQRVAALCLDREKITPYLSM